MKQATAREEGKRRLYRVLCEYRKVFAVYIVNERLVYITIVTKYILFQKPVNFFLPIHMNEKSAYSFIII
jgi:hypothetical protein